MNVFRLALVLLLLAVPALAQDLGTLTVTSAAGPALVTVDGKPAGRTPVTLSLAAGPHALRVARDGLQPFEQDLQVQPGANLAVEAALKLVEGPGQVLYVDAGDAHKVGQAWLALVKRTPALRGASLLSLPTRGWVGLASKPLGQMEPEAASEAARSLSDALDTRVLHLAITPDGRAWYLYWDQGKLVDRYCSNPGRAGEVDSSVLRSWAGRPEFLLPVCRGTPLSARRSEVSLTDLHGILYYYYPEMRQTRPAAWRSPADIMGLLTQVLGAPDPPAPFFSLAAWRGWKKL